LSNVVTLKALIKRLSLKNGGGSLCKEPEVIKKYGYLHISMELSRLFLTMKLNQGVRLDDATL
jgi:hypothetical protein